MSLPFLRTTAEMRRLSPHFPRARGIPRVDDRRVLSGILDVLRHGLRWRDAPLADASSSLPNVRNSRSSVRRCQFRPFRTPFPS